MLDDNEDVGTFSRLYFTTGRNTLSFHFPHVMYRRYDEEEYCSLWNLLQDRKWCVNGCASPHSSQILRSIILADLATANVWAWDYKEFNTHTSSELLLIIHGRNRRLWRRDDRFSSPLLLHWIWAASNKQSSLLRVSMRQVPTSHHIPPHPHRSKPNDFVCGYVGQVSSQLWGGVHHV